MPFIIYLYYIFIVSYFTPRKAKFVWSRSTLIEQNNVIYLQGSYKKINPFITFLLNSHNNYCECRDGLIIRNTGRSKYDIIMLSLLIFSASAE